MLIVHGSKVETEYVNCMGLRVVTLSGDSTTISISVINNLNVDVKTN
jgi:hypothetical protein